LQHFIRFHNLALAERAEIQLRSAPLKNSALKRPDEKVVFRPVTVHSTLPEREGGAY